MDFQSINSKIVLSKDNKILGRIVDVTKTASLDTLLTIECSLRRKKGKYVLSLRSYKLIKNIDDKVILDISIKEFSSLLKTLNVEQKQKAKAAKFGAVSKNDEAMARTLTGRW